MARWLVDGWNKAKQGRVKEFESTAFLQTVQIWFCSRVTTSSNDITICCLFVQIMHGALKTIRQPKKEHTLDMAIAEYKYLKFKLYLTNTF